MQSLPDLKTYSFPQLCEAAEEHPALRTRISTVFTRHVHRVLRGYFEDVDDFRFRLWSNDGVISGSLVLSLVLLNDGKESIIPEDMDIYVPVFKYRGFCCYLEEQGYKLIAAHADAKDPHKPGYSEFFSTQEQIKRFASDDDERALPPPYELVGDGIHYENQSITGVLKYCNAEGKRIDVISVKGNSVLEAILQFWGTPVMNWMTSDEVTVAYPNLTLKRNGCFSPWVPVGISRAVEHKYNDRGFLITPFDQRDTQCTKKKPDSFDCPHTIRDSRDAGCLSLSLLNVPGRPVSLPQNVTLWRFGGTLCGGHCERTQKAIIPHTVRTYL